MEFKVQGLTCGGCVRSVTNAIQQVDAAATVQVDLAAGRVSVTSSTDRRRVERAIRDAGYEVTEQQD